MHDSYQPWNLANRFTYQKGYVTALLIPEFQFKVHNGILVVNRASNEPEIFYESVTSTVSVLGRLMKRFSLEDKIWKMEYDLMHHNV